MEPPRATWDRRTPGRCCDAFFDSIGMELRGRALIDHMQSDEFSHAELERRARRVHERRLGEVVERTVAEFADGAVPPGELAGRAVEAGKDLFAAAIPVIPYAPAAAFLGKEKGKLNPAEGPRRVALIADAIGGVHGVSHTIERLRELGVPRYDVEVIGTDRSVDRRLPAAAEVEMPFYAGLQIGVPEPPGDGRGPRRGPLRGGPRDRARARRGDGGSGCQDHGAAGARQLAYGAGRLRGSAIRPRACSRGWRWPSRSSTASAATC